MQMTLVGKAFGLKSMIFTAFLLCEVVFAGQQSPLIGDWREPSGTVIRIEPCGRDLCLQIVSLSRLAPSQVDAKNPDLSKRSRSLCGLVIGKQFELSDPSHASGGFLYDPKSGNTYRGGMALDGDELRLRGYIGLPIFGRTETWYRNLRPFTPCGQ